jgi:LysR family transcriptional regulator (chromosome initiation inhibitor)
MVSDALAAKELALIAPGLWLDVPLYWQHAAIRSDTLRNMGTALQRAAKTSLLPVSA